MLSHQFVYRLTTFLFGLAGNGTTIYYADIGLLATAGSAYTGILQSALNRCSFRKVLLAAKRIINRFFIFEYSVVYHR